MKQAILRINGVDYPAPKRGMSIKIMTTVSDGRNETNAFIGQRVGRDLQKIESIEWPILSSEQWSRILRESEKFLFDVTYCDPVRNNWVTRKMYVSDREGQPYRIDQKTGKTIMYANCKCSFVDAGH